MGDGHVALWEWCRSATPGKDLSSVPAEQWGTYTEDQNTAVEEAFSAGRSSTKVCVGIRQYEIIFDGPDYGQQVDHKMEKRRVVRRRLVSPAERERYWKSLSGSSAGGDM